MNTKHLWVVSVVLLVFLLAGCTIEYDTVFNADQSGKVTEAIGMSSSELAVLNSTSGTPTDTSQICNTMFRDSSSNLPSDAVIRQEQKGDETWCYIDVPFKDLEALKSFYGDQSVTINRLEVANNTFYYDVDIDMSNMNTSGLGNYTFAMTWKVTMPGAVSSHNADSISGRTLTWDLSQASTSVNMTAQSSLSAANTWIWWVAGGLVCLCLVVLVIAAVVAVILYMRNKKKKESAPAETK